LYSKFIEPLSHRIRAAQARAAILGQFHRDTAPQSELPQGASDLAVTATHVLSWSRLVTAFAGADRSAREQALQLAGSGHVTQQQKRSNGTICYNPAQHGRPGKGRHTEIFKRMKQGVEAAERVSRRHSAHRSYSTKVDISW